MRKNTEEERTLTVMFNIKSNRCLKTMASLLFSSMVIFGGGNYAYADFDYSEHHYKTYNSLVENIADKDRLVAGQFSKYGLNYHENVPANKYILELEEIAAKANGLKIGAYTKAGDYKRIVQPIIISMEYNNSMNIGNFQIVLGTKDLRASSGYEYGNSKQNRNPYMDAKIIWVMGHEIGHGVLNHGTCKGETCKIDRNEDEERDADRVAWYTLEKTSDFGWGYAFQVANAYRTDNCNEEYVKKQTNNKLWISGTSPINSQYKLNINGKWYNARNLYNVLIESNYQFKFYVGGFETYTTALGQLGYIYSKEKKIDANKIEIVPETRYPYRKSKLIYRSPNMPNGYKTIAFFSSSVNDIAPFWNKGKYTETEGYSYKDAQDDLAELKASGKESPFVLDKAVIIAIKYAGINEFNGINYFH